MSCRSTHFSSRSTDDVVGVAQRAHGHILVGMYQHDMQVAATAWGLLLQAETANPEQLESLASKLAVMVEHDAKLTARVLLRAAVERKVYLLELLADAAPPCHAGVLHRMLGRATWERDELDECDADELPA